MLGLLAVGVIGVGSVVVLGWLSAEEEQTREHYYRENKTLKNELKQRTIEIDDVLYRNTRTQDFSRCMTMYKASIQTANACFNNYDQQKELLAICYRKKKKFSVLIGTLKQERDLLLATKKQQELINIRTQLNQVRKILKQINAEIMLLQENKDSLLIQLRVVNQKTVEFKKHIRDNCGNGGRVWYTKHTR